MQRKSAGFTWGINQWLSCFTLYVLSAQILPTHWLHFTVVWIIMVITLSSDVYQESKFPFVLLEWNRRWTASHIRNKRSPARRLRVKAYKSPAVFLQLKVSRMQRLQQRCKSIELTELLDWLRRRYEVDHLWVFPAPCCLAAGFSLWTQRETFWILNIWMPSQQIWDTELHCAQLELLSTDSFTPYSTSPLSHQTPEHWAPTER